MTCVQAKVTLRTTLEGGRQTGIKTGYRPNHVFEYKDGKFLNTHMGEILFDHDKVILPGETAFVTVCFVDIPEMEKYITVGRNWFLHEGGRLVGHVEIIKM